MDLNAIERSNCKNVYHLTSDTNVPLHKHETKDEMFYCVKGSGFDVLEDKEVELTVGK